MMRILLAFFALTTAVNFALAGSGDFPFAAPYFEDVGNRDSIPSGVVTSMTEAPNGLIWLGTQTGLLRFDGYRFEHYQLDPNDPDAKRLIDAGAQLPLSSGFISLQAESHPMEIRKVELMEIED